MEDARFDECGVGKAESADCSCKCKRRTNRGQPTRKEKGNWIELGPKELGRIIRDRFDEVSSYGESFLDFDSSFGSSSSGQTKDSCTSLERNDNKSNQ